MDILINGLENDLFDLTSLMSSHVDIIFSLDSEVAEPPQQISIILIEDDEAFEMSKNPNFDSTFGGNRKAQSGMISEN